MAKRQIEPEKDVLTLNDMKTVGTYEEEGLVIKKSKFIDDACTATKKDDEDIEEEEAVEDEEVEIDLSDSNPSDNEGIHPNLTEADRDEAHADFGLDYGSSCPSKKPKIEPTIPDTEDSTLPIISGTPPDDEEDSFQEESQVPTALDKTKIDKLATMLDSWINAEYPVKISKPLVIKQLPIDTVDLE